MKLFIRIRGISIVFLVFVIISLPFSVFADFHSSNWGGYVVAKNLATPQANTVDYVSGSWVVPRVICGPNETSYSSTWVGIDGFKTGGILTKAITQIGTIQGCNNGKEEYHLFYEAIDNNGNRIDARWIPYVVFPGARVWAYVYYKDNGNFELWLKNEVNGWEEILTISNPTSPRITAEWIHERSHNLLEEDRMPRFSPVTFSYATARVDDSLGSITHYNREHIRVLGPNMKVGELKDRGYSFTIEYSVGAKEKVWFYQEVGERFGNI